MYVQREFRRLSLKHNDKTPWIAGKASAIYRTWGKSKYVTYELDNISYPRCKKGIRYGLVNQQEASSIARSRRPSAIRLAERRYQAVSHFYKEDNEFIISSPLLALNFNNDKEIEYFFSF